MKEYIIVIFYLLVYNFCWSAEKSRKYNESQNLLDEQNKNSCTRRSSVLDETPNCVDSVESRKRNNALEFKEARQIIDIQDEDFNIHRINQENYNHTFESIPYVEKRQRVQKLQNEKENESEDRIFLAPSMSRSDLNAPNENKNKERDQSIPKDNDKVDDENKNVDIGEISQVQNSLVVNEREERPIFSFKFSLYMEHDPPPRGLAYQFCFRKQCSYSFRCEQIDIFFSLMEDIAITILFIFLSFLICNDLRRIFL